jgi:hypothetical protein
VAAEASAEETSHGQEDQLAEIQEKHPLPDKHACFDSCFGEAQRELKEPRLFFAPNGCCRTWSAGEESWRACSV